MRASVERHTVDLAVFSVRVFDRPELEVVQVTWWKNLA